MRITLDLDEDTLNLALAVSPGKTKTEVINDALQEYVRWRKVQELLSFEGKMTWTGDLDELRVRQGSLDTAGSTQRKSPLFGGGGRDVPGPER